MVMTPFEQTGNLTSIADGEDFLEDLVTAHSHLSMQLWGQPSGPATRLGMFTVTIGAGSPGMVVIGSIHGEEPAGREAAMAFARDLAESTDPVIEAYLEDHSVSILASANPYGSTNGIRNNANGENLNRDYDILSQPELQAINRWMLWAIPALAVDLHEMTASTMPFATSTDHSEVIGYEPLWPLGAELETLISDDLIDAGHTWQTYPSVPDGSIQKDGSARWKIVVELMETNRNVIYFANVAARIAAQMIAVNNALAHHRTNAAAYEAAHIAAGGTGGGGLPPGPTAGRSIMRSGAPVPATAQILRGGTLVPVY